MLRAHADGSTSEGVRAAVFTCAAALWLLDRELQPLIDRLKSPACETHGELYFSWLAAARAVLEAGGALEAGRKARLPRWVPREELAFEGDLQKRFESLERCVLSVRAATKDPARTTEVIEAARAAAPEAAIAEIVSLALGGSSTPFTPDAELARELKRRPRAKDLVLLDWPGTRELAFPRVKFNNNSAGVRGALMPTGEERGERGPLQAQLRLAVDHELRANDWEEMDKAERVDWFVEDVLLGHRDWKPLSWFDSLDSLFSSLAGNDGEDLLVGGEVHASLPKLIAEQGRFVGGAVSEGTMRTVIQFERSIWVLRAVV